MQPGREWELLVAQLETLFAGPGFRVQSPEDIRSKRTGNIVKVDVTVRGRVGAQDVLIAFECRDRDDRQGVEWIQQLPTRKQDIGASELIAVSRDGFTADAQREAAAHGIPLRTLSRLDLDEVASLVLGIEMNLRRARYQASKVDFSHLRLQPLGIDCNSSSWPQFTPELLQEALAKPDAPQFRDRQTGRMLSVVDMIHLADWESGFAGGDFDGPRVHVAKLFSESVDEFGEPSGRLEYVLDDRHWVRLDGFAFIGEVWWDDESVGVSQVLRYSRDDATLATVAEFDLSPHGIPHRLQVFLGGPSDGEPSRI